MLVLQGFVVCRTPPLTPEQAMERDRRRASIRERMRATSMLACATDNHMPADVKSMKKRKGDFST